VGKLAQNQSLDLIGCALEYVRIGDHYLGTMFEYPLQGLGGIPCLRNYFNIGLVFQQTPQPLAQQDVIVHQKATNLFFAKKDFGLYLCGGTHRAAPY
jgi:hypothetical protein